MKPSALFVTFAGLVLSIAAAVWVVWQRNDEPSPPRYYRTSDAGIRPPTVLHEQKPGYPKEAMNANIQGAVFMECTVQPTGICSDIQVARSLDPVWLDREAIRALEQWRFTPGTLRGEPVPVRVDIEFRFAVRPPAGG